MDYPVKESWLLTPKEIHDGVREESLSIQEKELRTKLIQAAVNIIKAYWHTPLTYYFDFEDERDTYQLKLSKHICNCSVHKE